MGDKSGKIGIFLRQKKVKLFWSLVFWAAFIMDRPNREDVLWTVNPCPQATRLALRSLISWNHRRQPNKINP